MKYAKAQWQCGQEEPGNNKHEGRYRNERPSSIAALREMEERVQEQKHSRMWMGVFGWLGGRNKLVYCVSRGWNIQRFRLETIIRVNANAFLLPCFPSVLYFCWSKLHQESGGSCCWWEYGNNFEIEINLTRSENEDEEGVREFSWVAVSFAIEADWLKGQCVDQKGMQREGKWSHQ